MQSFSANCVTDLVATIQIAVTMIFPALKMRGMFVCSLFSNGSLLGLFKNSDP